MSKKIIAILLALNVGNAVFQISVWAIVADCIEVSYRKTGKAEEGSLYALYSFFRKLSQGIGQAVVSVGLGAIGFVEGENAVQPENFGSDVKNLYILNNCRVVCTLELSKRVDVLCSTVLNNSVVSSEQLDTNNTLV